jgi:uncharacterized protein YjiS (DUF1127 family)
MFARTDSTSTDGRETGARTMAPAWVPLLRTCVFKLGAAVARAYRLRRDARELARYSDRMLHDVGLGRGGIEGAVRMARGGA